ncbi:MAG: toxin [Omnitrophica WOR_2 bacterium RIFCSPHIGHO2_01_FULL_52_10]|nr:MAG: toxin [Omnitrophica WOR_2 bacterium RIFCSPHIGHO2_01_FULL_52_10]
MKRLDWNIEKNKKLIKERNISFEEIVIFIEQGKLLDIVDNPSPRYHRQKMFVLDVEGYVYLVPFVETEETYNLVTIFPSRKATKEYFQGGK